MGESGERKRSDRSVGSNHRLRPSGGYRRLRSYQVATVIYDATVSFCDRFISKRSRTHDQMVQAARSGGKNIGEGSRAAAISSQTELRLVNIARASLEELLLDFEDFLRQQKLPAWDQFDAEAIRIREVPRRVAFNRADPAAHYRAYSEWLDHPDPAVVANAVICLIHQANYLLDRQINALEREFVQDGGYSEQLAAARLAARKLQSADRGPAGPHCPLCGAPLVKRIARKGAGAGTQFWGCSKYPSCRGTRPWTDPTDPTDRTDRTDPGN
jgi:restriction system protein